MSTLLTNDSHDDNIACDGHSTNAYTVRDSVVPVFHPEYGRFMLESTPGEPYNGSVNDLLSVERNMRFRSVFVLLPLETRLTLLVSYPPLQTRDGQKIPQTQ